MPSADNSGEVSRQFVLNLKAAIGDQSNRAVERLTGVNDDTIASILEGDSWPDLDIIARLERGFGVVLWPGLVDLDE